jgi:hypothetical protein
MRCLTRQFVAKGSVTYVSDGHWLQRAAHQHWHPKPSRSHQKVMDPQEPSLDQLEGMKIRSLTRSRSRATHLKIILPWQVTVGGRLAGAIESLTFRWRRKIVDALAGSSLPILHLDDGGRKGVNCRSGYLHQIREPMAGRL